VSFTTAAFAYAASMRSRTPDASEPSTSSLPEITACGVYTPDCSNFRA